MTQPKFQFGEPVFYRTQYGGLFQGRVSAIYPDWKGTFIYRVSIDKTYWFGAKESQLGKLSALMRYCNDRPGNHSDVESQENVA